MPTYEYRCENAHLFEVRQKMTEQPLTECVECGAPVVKVMHSPAVHFKGSGFYNTDYGTSKRKREMEKSASEGADSNDAKQKDKQESKGSSSSESSGSGAGSDSSSSSSSSSSGSGSGSADTKSE